MPKLASQMAEWSTSHPLATSIISLCFQLLLLTAFAWLAVLVYRRATKDTSLFNESFNYVVWLSVTCLGLLVGPVQLFTKGLPIPVASVSSLTQIDTSENETAVAPEEREWSLFPLESTREPAGESLFINPQSQSSLPEAQSPAPFSAQPISSESKLNPEHPVVEAGVSPPSKSAKLRLWPWLTLAYALPLAWFTWGWVAGTWSLHRLAKRGCKLAPSELELARQVARHLQLNGMPTLRSAPVPVPLVCGLGQPIVLVPTDFSSWTAREQRTVLMHEFAHVQRRDTWGEVLTQLMQSLYWFHPASWFVAERLRKSRELATDERVVQSGIDGKSYARDLVSVLERLANQPRTNRQAVAVAMSDFTSIEERVGQLLKPHGNNESTHEQQRWRLSFLTAFVVLLILLSGATTVRLTPLAVSANASEPQEPLQPVSAPNASVPAAQDELETPTSDASWFSRFENCTVQSLATGEGSLLFNFRGKALRSDGTPAAGAIVLLREDASQRVILEPTAFLDERQVPVEDPMSQARERKDDVFAKVTTDAQGNFRFTDVRVPAVPAGQDGWSWEVICADTETAGAMGWATFNLHDLPTLSERDIQITLSPTESLQGVVVDTNDKPVPDTLVCYNGFGKQFAEGKDGLEFSTSQLSLLARTDHEGKFVVAGLPRNKIASFYLYHPDLVPTPVRIATTKNMLNSASPQTNSTVVTPILASPARVVMDSGVLVQGKIVNDQGEAIAGATVLEAVDYSVGLVQSDANGEFQYRFGESFFTREYQVNSTLKILAPKETDYLPELVKLDLESLKEGKRVTIAMQKGVRVSGMLRSLNRAAQGVSVIHEFAPQHSHRELSDQDGRFDLVLPQGKTRLMLADDGGQFALPSVFDVLDAIEHPEWADDWLKNPELASSPYHIDVDTSLGAVELPPLEVRRLGPLQVTAFLPDGSPANGAFMIAKDIHAEETPNAPQEPNGNPGQAGENPFQPLGGNPFLKNENPFAPDAAQKPSPTVEEVSGVRIADVNGRVALQLFQRPLVNPYVEVRHTVGDMSYIGKAPLADVAKGNLSVQLQKAWTIRGRVTVDGKPFEGVDLMVHEKSEGVVQTVHATSDSNGYYSFAVQPQRRGYAFVWISHTPNRWPARGSGRIQSETNGLLQVEEIQLEYGTEKIGGQVVDTQGTPVGDADVRISIPFQFSRQRGPVGDKLQIKTDPQGRFVFERLPAGEYGLTVSSEKRPGARMSLKTRTGTEDLVLELGQSQTSN